MKTLRISTLILALTAALAFTGCARFVTKQTDLSYDDQGNPQRAITTTAKATTFLDAKSNLSNFKAAQTDKNQTAVVGSLNSESSGSNAVHDAAVFMGTLIRTAK